jgi:hypothetical protein
MYVEVADGSGLLEVSIEFLTRKLSPTVASKAGYAARVAMGLDPCLIG